MADEILAVVISVGLWLATAIYWHVLKKDMEKRKKKEIKEK